MSSGTPSQPTPPSALVWAAGPPPAKGSDAIDIAARAQVWKLFEAGVPQSKIPEAIGMPTITDLAVRRILNQEPERLEAVLDAQADAHAAKWGSIFDKGMALAERILDEFAPVLDEVKAARRQQRATRIRNASGKDMTPDEVMIDASKMVKLIDAIVKIARTAGDSQLRVRRPHLVAGARPIEVKIGADVSLEAMDDAAIVALYRELVRTGAIARLPAKQRELLEHAGVPTVLQLDDAEAGSRNDAT